MKYHMMFNIGKTSGKYPVHIRQQFDIVLFPPTHPATVSLTFAFLSWLLCMSHPPTRDSRLLPVIVRLHRNLKHSLSRAVVSFSLVPRLFSPPSARVRSFRSSRGGTGGGEDRGAKRGCCRTPFFAPLGSAVLAVKGQQAGLASLWTRSGLAQVGWTRGAFGLDSRCSWFGLAVWLVCV